ncbi:ABA receptor [Tripterygium wilfordii]|uniref:ABA receptor n=1 Tax=Tripterygium wilfordii TaxID=458696 RepID=A0A7J7DAT6_TRIWF|nr:ABA receptor [Tripterygium wilfordii]
MIEWPEEGVVGDYRRTVIGRTYTGAREENNRRMNGNSNINEFGSAESEYIRRHHRPDLAENQCSSALVKHIKAPVPLNYSSIISLHPEIIDGRPGTLVIESFVVDVPDGNTKDETCYFIEALIKCNLKSLADVSERLAVQDRTEPIDQI